MGDIFQCCRNLDEIINNRPSVFKRRALPGWLLHMIYFFISLIFFVVACSDSKGDNFTYDIPDEIDIYYSLDAATYSSSFEDQPYASYHHIADILRAGCELKNVDSDAYHLYIRTLLDGIDQICTSFEDFEFGNEEYFVCTRMLESVENLSKCSCIKYSTTVFFINTCHKYSIKIILQIFNS